MIEVPLTRDDKLRKKVGFGIDRGVEFISSKIYDNGLRNKFEHAMPLLLLSERMWFLLFPYSIASNLKGGAVEKRKVAQ
jgi:hypothetical protein